MTDALDHPVTDPVARLAGELFHVDRLERRAAAAAAGDDPAWAAHCAERVDAQRERIAALLAMTDHPDDMLNEAEQLLGGKKA